jgi:hypothetical protein
LSSDAQTINTVVGSSSEVELVDLDLILWGLHYYAPQSVLFNSYVISQMQLSGGIKKM